MTYFELKKIFSKSFNKAALILLAASLCVVSCFAIRYVDYVDESGKKTVGIAAARALREKKNEWAGRLTEDVLRKVLEENARINDSAEYLSDDVTENNKAYAKKQGFSDIRGMINEAFCDFRDYDYYRADSVTPEEIGSFYERRTANLAKWLYSEEQKSLYSERERLFLIERYEKLETPYYYEYADGWKTLLEYAPTIIMTSVLFMSFFAAGIFSDETRLKADSIFFSSRFGRNKAVRAKISAGFLAITSIYWATIFLYSGIVLTALGAGGANCAIQTGMAGWKSFYNVTFLQEYLLTVLGGYIGNLFILFLSMFVSAKTRSKTFAVTIPFILLFLPSFLNGIPVLSKALGLLPDQLLQITAAMETFNLYQIGTKVTGSLSIILTMYLILLIVILPVLYQVYRKTEIK